MPSLPYGHVFRPPAGLKDPIIEKDKRDSVYVAKPWPSKKKDSKEQLSNNKALKTGFGDLVKISETKTKIAAKNNNIKGNGLQESVALKRKSGPIQPQCTVKRNVEAEHRMAQEIPTRMFNGINGMSALYTMPSSYDSFLNRKESASLLSAKTRQKTQCNQKVGSVKPHVIEKTKSAESCGAIGKAKAMQLRKNDIAGPSLKPKLAVNLKAKKTNNGQKTSAATVSKKTNSKHLIGTKEFTGNKLSTESGAFADKSEKIVGFTTSTQIKAIRTSNCSNTPKPIPFVGINQAKLSNAKRDLFQEQTKNNFLKSIKFDDSITDVSLILPDITNQEQNFNMQDSKMKSQVSPKTELASKAMEKMRHALREKAYKPQMCVKSPITPRRSLKRQCSPAITARRSFKLVPSLTKKESPMLDAAAEKLVETSLGHNVVNEELEDGAVKFDPTTHGDTSKEVEGTFHSCLMTVSYNTASGREEERRNSMHLQKTAERNINSVSGVQIPIERCQALEAVHSFRLQLQVEIQRLHTLCDQWNAYKEEQLELLQANGGEDMINVTVGQTRLLTSKKFMQFNSLIDRCEAHANGNEDTKTVTPMDLEGFWSMLGLQVENIQKRFQDLERWKDNGWEDPDAVKQKPRIKKNLTKVKNVKANMSTTCGKMKPGPNTELRKIMLKMLAEKRAKNRECANIAQSPEIQVYAKEHSPSCSPRHLRLSTHNNDNLRRRSLSNTPDRMRIVVPDRRFHSLVPTVISVQSSIQSSPHDLLKAALLKQTRHTRSMQLKENENALVSTEIVPKYSTPSKPIPTDIRESELKSILKTPGTERNRLRNVAFSEHLSVKKFRRLNYDNDRQSTDDEGIQQIHIDDFRNMKSKSPDLLPTENTGKNEDERAYCLRSRRVRLRPSCEIELPK